MWQAAAMLDSASAAHGIRRQAPLVPVSTAIFAKTPDPARYYNGRVAGASHRPCSPGTRGRCEDTNMASIRKEIMTRASADDVWSALRDVGALHTRLVPGFVTDTVLEPAARIVTFGNGMVVRELTVDVNEDLKRVVW